MMDDGKDTDAVIAAWKSEVRDFDRTRRQYFLYR